MNKKKEISPKTVAPRDGYDNTGTQGKDSLSDDALQARQKNQAQMLARMMKVVPAAKTKIFTMRKKSDDKINYLATLQRQIAKPMKDRLRKDAEG